MSLLRSCNFCPRRLRGATPGVLTILLDGQPLDAAIVVCTEHAIDIRRVLDGLRQRSVVAQHARTVDVTQPLTPVPAAPTEAFPRVTVPLITPRQPRRNLASLRPIWRGERPH